MVACRVYQVDRIQIGPDWGNRVASFIELLMRTFKYIELEDQIQPCAIQFIIVCFSNKTFCKYK